MWRGENRRAETESELYSPPRAPPAPGRPTPGQGSPPPWPSTHLPLWPNRRKRTQKMMQVTPMWMPMTIPVVDIWLVASSFRQSHGGLRAV